MRIRTLIAVTLSLLVPRYAATALTPEEIPSKVIQSVVQLCSDGVGCGTGALLEDGRILTALHVLSVGCWSGYCDSYSVRTAGSVGSDAKRLLDLGDLEIDRLFPGLDIAILKVEKPVSGIFSLEDVVPLRQRSLYSLDFANGRALRFDEGRLATDRVTYATSTILGGKGSSGAPVFDADYKLAGVRVASASWKDAVQGVFLPYGKGALTPASILSEIHEGPIALGIARGLNAHHQSLRECDPNECVQERGFFLSHVAELSHYLGELNSDLAENKYSWYTIFSFFRGSAPTTELGEELELLSLAYELELHIGPLREERKAQVLKRVEDSLLLSPRRGVHQERLFSLLEYGRTSVWSKRSFTVPEFTDEIISALAFPLVIWSILLLALGVIVGCLFKNRIRKKAESSYELD